MYCIFINLMRFIHDRGNPIRRIDVNKLIDWLIDWLIPKSEIPREHRNEKSEDYSKAD